MADVITPERINGKFAPGHPYCGRSDLHALQVTKRRAILNATTSEEALAVIRAMHAAALEGNTQAAALYLMYAVGKPESIDPKEAGQVFDVQNLNKSAADLTPEQRRARLQYLMEQKQKESQ